MRVIRFACILFALAASGQQNAPTVKFSATSNLVVVDVTVKDRSGKNVDTLKKQDFTILEDGKPQAISVFEVERLELEAEPAAAPSAPKPAQPKTERKQAANTITVVKPNQVQYQDKRLMVMFFDFSSMPPADQIRAQQSALKFLDSQMTANDMVAVMTFSSQLKIEQDFTNDRDALKDVINNFHIGESSELAVEADTADTDTGEDTGAAFVADQTEFNIFNTDQKLSALETAAKKLALLPEKKALVYFSSGVGKTGVENQSQLRSTINAAVRSNVSFYPIDARGLVASAPAGDANQAASRGTGLYTGAQQTRLRDRFNDQQETLSTLAADTGGKVFLDNNDLSLGIVQAQKDLRTYYILGYYSTNAAVDGRFRRIQVKVAGVQNAKVDYRSGYFGPKEFGKFDAGDKERQLEEALSLGDPVTDLPLALEVDYFRVGKLTYFVPVAVKIPGSEVALRHRGASGETEFDFIGQVTDEKNKVVANVRDGIKIKLTDDNAKQLVRRSLQYDTGFTLAPGKYRIRFLARENQTGKMGTFDTKFEIPDLNTVKTPLKLSSVVWSNQREPLSAAVGSAEKQKKLTAMNPLVQEGQKLVPSITRVFRKDQSLYVYAEVYDAAADPADKSRAVSATLSFLDKNGKAFESTPVKSTQPLGSRGEAVPIEFQVPLAKLNPGRYTCQLNVVDEIGRKFAFPRASVVLLP